MFSDFLSHLEWRPESPCVACSEHCFVCCRDEQGVSFSRTSLSEKMVAVNHSLWGVSMHSALLALLVAEHHSSPTFWYVMETLPTGGDSDTYLARAWSGWHGDKRKPSADAPVQAVQKCLEHKVTQAHQKRTSSGARKWQDCLSSPGASSDIHGDHMGRGIMCAFCHPRIVWSDMAFIVE